jgi:hypothetical protein
MDEWIEETNRRMWIESGLTRMSACNSTFGIGGVSCSADSFVVIENSVLRLNICGEKPANRKSAEPLGVIMMRVCFIMIFLLMMLQSFGQKYMTASSIDLVIGSKLYFHSFYDALNTVDSYRSYSPVHFVGISRSGRMYLTRGKDFDGHFSFGQILSKRIQLNDTIRPTIGGFIFGFSYGRDLLRASKLFDAIFGIGFSTGRLKLNDMVSINQKNPFFAPKLSLQPKINLNKITIAIRIEYEYDISQPTWSYQRNRPNRYDGVNSFNQTSLTCIASIGYIVNKYR